jgi:two-component system NarL family response regulator
MPRLNGIDATAAITRQNSDVNVVVLSTFDEDEYIYQSIQAGAKGYVLKGDNLNALIDVVQAAALGKSLLPPHIATKLIERISHPPQQLTLTARELEVLQLMATGMRNKEIGAELHITERTVKNHVAKIIAKLDVKSRTEAVAYALKEKFIRLE